MEQFCCCAGQLHFPINPNDILGVLSDVLPFLPTDLNRLILHYARCPVYFMDMKPRDDDDEKKKTYVLQRDPLTQVDKFVGIASCPASPRNQSTDPVSQTIFMFSDCWNSRYSIWDIRRATYVVQDERIPWPFTFSFGVHDIRWVAAQDTLYVCDVQWRTFKGIVSGKWENVVDSFWRQVDCNYHVDINDKFAIVGESPRFRIRFPDFSSCLVAFKCAVDQLFLISDFLIVRENNRWSVLDLEVLFQFREPVCLSFSERFEFFFFDSQRRVLCMGESATPGKGAFAKEILTFHREEMENPHLRLNPVDVPDSRNFVTRLLDLKSTFLLHPSNFRWEVKDDVAMFFSASGPR